MSTSEISSEVDSTSQANSAAPALATKLALVFINIYYDGEVNSYYLLQNTEVHSELLLTNDSGVLTKENALHKPPMQADILSSYAFGTELVKDQDDLIALLEDGEMFIENTSIFDISPMASLLDSQGFFINRLYGWLHPKAWSYPLSVHPINKVIRYLTPE